MSKLRTVLITLLAIVAGVLVMRNIITSIDCYLIGKRTAYHLFVLAECAEPAR